MDTITKAVRRPAVTAHEPSEVWSPAFQAAAAQVCPLPLLSCPPDGACHIMMRSKLKPMFSADSHLDSQPRDSAFTNTHWSVVLAAGDGGSPQCQEALEELCR